MGIVTSAVGHQSVHQLEILWGNVALAFFSCYMLIVTCCGIDIVMDNSVIDIFKNVYFWSACAGWTVAQCTKMLITFCNTRKLDFSYLVSTGGMPSAHSALVCSLATSVGLRQGFGSPVFMIAFALALITMFDASTVRRAAGLQARLLNQMVQELFKKHKFSEKKLAELLGHTRLEVFMGFIIGILVGVIVVSISATIYQ